jgi:hypothetical protein
VNRVKNERDINKTFCRLLRTTAQMDLTARELNHFRKNAGCLRSQSFGGTYYYIEWPKMAADGGTYTWEGQSDNADHAKAEAINDWLTRHSAAVRARHLEHGFPGSPSC